MFSAAHPMVTLLLVTVSWAAWLGVSGHNFPRVGAADSSSDVLNGGLVFLGRKLTDGEMFTYIRTELVKQKQMAGLVSAP